MSQKELLPKEWCVACKHDDTDTLELLKWRGFGWTGSGFITNDKVWIDNNEGFINPKPVISYETFLELVYNPWKHPQTENQTEKWCIEITEDNEDILIPWWKETNPKSEFGRPLVGNVLLSKHPTDTSMYWSGDIKHFLISHPDYTSITLEEFKTIISKPKPVETNKTIQISRTLLNEYYEAATMAQQEFINTHFKIDGTTTVASIIGLHNIACNEWKSIIKANHPDCFPVTKSAIELAVEKAGNPNYSGCNVKIEDDHILVKLPTANKDWSFAAFEWVIKFCKKNPRSYPVHRNEHNTTDYLYIQWND